MTKKNKKQITVADIDNLIKEDLEKIKPSKEELEKWDREGNRPKVSLREKYKINPICPECKSTDVNFINEEDIRINYRCNKCKALFTYIDDSQLL